MTEESHRVLVTGSRNWRDRECVRRALDDALKKHGNLFLVHGACPSGADAMAERWAWHHAGRGVRVERHPANWGKHGRAAGPIRNKAMVAAGADLCLAFIRGGSRGASQCAEAAEAAGIPVVIHREDG